MNHTTNGRYIAIEGVSGSGKTTQIGLLASRLRADGYKVRVFAEPLQGDISSQEIHSLITNPRYPVNNRTEALLYSAVRSQGLEVIDWAKNSDVICLTDQSFLSQLVEEYYGKGIHQDYESLKAVIEFAVNDLTPDMTIVLDAPVHVLVDRLKSSKDHNEEIIDETYLERIRAGYLWEAKQRNYPVVFTNNSPDKTSEAIVQVLHGELSTGSVAAEAPPPLSLSVPAATPIKEVLESKIEQLKSSKETGVDHTNDENDLQLKDSDAATLGDLVSSESAQAYVLKNMLPPAVITAALIDARSQIKDLREVLNELVTKRVKTDQNWIDKTIGPDDFESSLELTGVHVVLDGCSDILSRKISMQRLASVIELRGPHIASDIINQFGKKTYHIPPYLPKKLKASYKQCMDSIFDLYSEMVHSLTEYVQDHSKVPENERDMAWKKAMRAQACDAIRPVLPVATKSTVGIYASGQALESMIMHLLSDELPEAQTTGQAILEQARKTIPTFLERADKPDRGGATIAYRANTYAAVKKVADEKLPGNLGSLDDDVQLVDVWPRNELDLLPHMLYEHSTMSLRELKRTINTWTYDEKLEAFNTYIGERLNRRHRPGRALEIAHYTWDLLCDYVIFRDLQRHRMVDAFDWQFLTPRYGFDIPELVEQAGLSEQFERCFDLSAELYSMMQAEGFALEAQYATLLGHRMRWKITYNAREAFHLHELRTSPQGHPGYRKLVQQMHDKLAEVHPMLANAMKFVNKGEDEELTRLAAERYTQFKLSQIQ